MPETVKKVLMVEDDPSIRKIAEISLIRVGGFDALVVESGSEAIRRFIDFQPDVILLDVNMPGMTGPEILQKLHEMGRTLLPPIIFLTGKTQREEIAQLISIGAVGVICKPFDPIKLPNQINQLLAQLSRQVA